MRPPLLPLFPLLLGLVAPIGAQAPQPLSRRTAIEVALHRAPALAVARADTALASARVVSARALPDPVLSAGYSRDIPRYHLTAELPLDFPWLRSTRIRSAEQARDAATLAFSWQRGLVALAADTGYTMALAAREVARLSAANAIAADSLRLIAVARRAAGDASDLDVELATIVAGQQANLAAGDSLAALTAVLDLQAMLGLSPDSLEVRLTDSLTMPDSLPAELPPPGHTLPERSAALSVSAAESAARYQHRMAWFTPALTFGFDAGDPTGETHGLLPTFGIAVPLPIFNRNRGAIAEAEAARRGAEAELAQTRLTMRTMLIQARRNLDGARARVARDRSLVASATRVARLSLTAYREGAAPLSSVIDAQRNARDVLSELIADLAAAAVADAQLRLLTLPPEAPPT